MNNTLPGELNSCSDPAITDLPIAYAWIEIIVYPILLVICTVGNVVVLMVVVREYRRHPSSTQVYLFTIALTSLVFLWQRLPMYIWSIQENFLTTDPDESFLQFIIVYSGISTWATVVLAGISDWTLIVFSVERLVAVLRPIEAKRYICPRTAKITVIVGCFLVLISSPQSLVTFFYSYTHDNPEEEVIEVPKWMEEWGVVTEGFNIAIYIITFFLLLIINIILVVFLTHRRQRQQSLSSTSSSCAEIVVVHQQQTSGGRKKFRMHSNLLLLSSYALYFATHLVPLVMTILTLAAFPPFCSFVFPGDSQIILLSMGNLLILANYSLKIIFYGAVSRKFRQPFFGCLLKNNREARFKKSISTTVTGS